MYILKGTLFLVWLDNSIHPTDAQDFRLIVRRCFIWL